MSKVGAWAGKPSEVGTGPAVWDIPLNVRNGSELPVRVDAVDLAVRPWGYERVLAAPEGTTEVDYYADKRLGDSDELHFAPGTVAPGETWGFAQSYAPEVTFDRPEPPMASITRVVVTDAAGHQWETRSSKGGPPRRVRRWRRWWWKRHGKL